MLRAARSKSALRASRRVLNIQNASFHQSAWISNGQRSPLQVFVETFKKEWSKSKELQDDIKALTDETGKMSESAAFKKAKEALEKARSGTHEASSATGEGLRRAGKVVGSAASSAWDSTLVRGTRKAVSSAADSVDRATEPIRKTELYQNVKNVIDDGSSIRYGGFEEKEARRKKRQAEKQRRLKESGQTGPIQINPDAGSSVVPHATAKPDRKFAEEFERTALGKKWQDIKIAYEESENEFISSIRTITDKIGGFFEETEGARAVRLFKEMDPTFKQEEFLNDVRAYILPEVLDAYVKGEGDTLKQWLSEAPYNVWKDSTKEYTRMGAFAAGKVLDIRGVDIVSAKVQPETQRPVYLIGCRAQEIHLYKSIKTGEVVAGVEDKVQMSTYVMAMTRVPEEIANPETHGWKIIELSRGPARDWT